MLRRAIQFVLVTCLGLTASSCAVMMMGQGHEGGTGLLSDAAIQASPDTTTKYKIDPPDVGYTAPSTAEVAVSTALDVAPSVDDGDHTSSSPGYVSAQPERPERHKHFLAALVMGGGSLGGRDYDGFSTVGAGIGGYVQPRLRLDAIGSINNVNFAGEGLLGEAFTMAGELSLDLTARYYLTRDHTFMGIYPQAGIGTGTLFWNYARPVTVIEDGVPKVLSDDRLNYFSVFAGAGLSLMQTKYVHVGGNLIGGARFYGWHTGSGLENNMLKTPGYLKALVEVSFRVGSSQP